MNKLKIIAVGLSGILFLAVQYIVLYNFTLTNQQQMKESIQQAYDKGVEDAVTTLFDQTQNCNMIPIRVGNITKILVDTECLKSSEERSFP
ncbi:MAG TPA: hypothetical protein VLD38_07750 [Nitrosopumilaceae archaeon]|nr:hypothetical protein [Nitrosopumilaceae archaeon]